MSETVKHEILKHITVLQAEAEQAFLAEFQAGNYTPAKPLVKLNPYLLAPLSAVILFRTPSPTQVTVIVKGKEAAGDISHTFPQNQEHILPIYGLYADDNNTVEIVLGNGERSSVNIWTYPVNLDVPKTISCETTPGYMGDNLIFLTAATRSKPAAYDYRGDIRWYSDQNLCWDIQRLPSGRVRIGTERLAKMPYYVTGIYEMAWSGKVFKEYRVPGAYHHDTFPLADGNLLVLTEDLNTSTVEDMLVLLDKDTGNIIKTWDYKNAMPQAPTGGSGSQDAHDWFHNNAVWYDPKTNSLSLSGRHQDVVINIDYDTGALNWIIGDPEGWPEDMQKYFFKPVGDGDFDWQYEQHACVVLPDGDIMMFDNGHWRSKVKEKYLPAVKNFSRGVRYRIDTEKMEIEQVWQYGKERGAEFFSPYICNVEYYDEGHYMVHSGGIAYKDGQPAEGLGAQLSIGPTANRVVLRSITCELVDDKVVHELKVAANMYRAEKMPLYYPGETIDLSPGQILGSLGVTKETKCKLPASSGELLPAHYEASMLEEIDRITFNGIFEEGEYAILALVGEDGSEHTYQLSTVPENLQAMCVGTFLKDNPQSVDISISKGGLQGKYAVKLQCEDKLYETGVTIIA